MEEGSLCIFVTRYAVGFVQKSNEEVNEVWIFNQDLSPCLVSNFLVSENT